MPDLKTRRYANLGGFLVACALIAYALYAQYVLYLEPCPLCLFQRFAVIAVGVLFLLAALHNPQSRGAKVYALVIVIAVIGGMLISARHIWIQSQPAGSVPACGASLSYLFDIMSFTEVLSKVFTGSGECAKIDWRFLGLSMPAWTAISLATLGTWGAITNWRFKR